MRYERRLVVCCIVCETMKCIRSSEEEGKGKERRALG
jgi:hypothetical protein